MFGPVLRIKYDGLGISLVPLKREWMPEIAERMTLSIRMYTHGVFALTPEDEFEWYEKARQKEDSVHWAILPDGCDFPVGTTGLGQIDPISGSCGSGIIIWDKDWWGRGVASRAHLIRTWYAADWLNRLTIYSSVRVPNPASRKALERVGYTQYAITPRDDYRNGNFLDTWNLVWMHPEKINVLYPDPDNDPVPEMYLPGIERAAIALNKARDLVQIL